jgi:hypothetical protein
MNPVITLIRAGLRAPSRHLAYYYLLCNVRSHKDKPAQFACLRLWVH